MGKKQKESWEELYDFGLPYVEVLKKKERQKREATDATPEPAGDAEQADLTQAERVSMVHPIGEIPESEMHPEIEKDGSGEKSSSEENSAEEAIALSGTDELEDSQEDLPGELIEEETPDQGVPEELEASPGKKKKSSRWIVYVIIAAILLNGVVVWQLLYGDLSEEEKVNQTSEVGAEVPSGEEKSTSQELEQQANEEAAVSLSDAASESEDGSNIVGKSRQTIEADGAPSLSRIEFEQEYPRYFIVVSSVPTAGLAMKEVEKYQSRVNQLYLISPYEGSPNYRLAIGNYSSFPKADEALNQLKEDYTEDLWILKY